MEPKKLNEGKLDIQQVKVLVIMGFFETKQTAYNIQFILCSGNLLIPLRTVLV